MNVWEYLFAANASDLESLLTFLLGMICTRENRSLFYSPPKLSAWIIGREIEVEETASIRGERSFEAVGTQSKS
jgi:hypothetical protein